MTFTPGPWEIRENATKYEDLKEYDVLAPNTEPDNCYSGLHYMVAAQLDSLDDARLIAAAPDLLAACEAIAGMKLSPQTKHAELLALCMAIAKTAVDKAEGKS